MNGYTNRDPKAFCFRISVSLNLSFHTLPFILTNSFSIPYSNLKYRDHYAINGLFISSSRATLTARSTLPGSKGLETFAYFNVSR